MYTLIEEIDNVAGSERQPQSQQQSLEAYKMMMQGRRPDIPSSYPNREVAHRYNYRNSPPPQYYEEPPRKTSIEQVMTQAPPKQEIRQESQAAPAKVSAEIGNDTLMNYINNITAYANNAFRNFSEREHNLVRKIDMLEQLVKGIGILLIVVIIVMLVKK